MKIQFLGAVKTVTGSCYLLTANNLRILLDCGQFQGGRKVEELNKRPFEFDPSTIDFLILSHAHIDHSGRIPLLAKEGFRGKILCTQSTYNLAEILLKDAGYIHEKEAEWENRKRARAGKQPIAPLYTLHDAEKSLVFFQPMLYDQSISITDTIKLRFQDAGHILGSSIVELWITESGKTSKLVFSGDLGMKNRPLLRNPASIEEADYLIVESTYGDRLHEDVQDRTKKLIDIILKTIKRGGTVVIPSFAVGRTQEMIYELNKYYDDKRLSREEFDNIHVYIDSPLAISATEIFRANAQVFNQETRDYILSGDNPLDFKNLHFTRTVEESIALNTNDEPKVIISSSGMCDAGRIKHHLKHHLWKKDSSIVFVGYQAQGTLGRRIKDGEKNVKIFGEEIHVNAEIHSIDGFSGHADQNELLDWLHNFIRRPNHIFLVHGENDSKVTFQSKIKEELGYDTIIPELGVEYELEQSISKVFPQKDDDQIDLDQLAKVKDDLYTLKEDFINTLYRTSLALSQDTTDEEYTKIKNKLIELEKDVINLSILTGDQKIS